MQQKQQLNPDPIGPAHIWWPKGAPTQKVPKRGVYAILHPSNVVEYEGSRPNQPNWFPQDQLDRDKFTF